LSKKYEFTGETLEYAGTTLHRIRARVDYPDHIGIEAGEVGGWIESKDNLSEDAWVADEAKVYGHACVSGEALIQGNAEVRDEARVWATAYVSGCAVVGGEARVYGWAIVQGNSRILGEVYVSGDSTVSGDALVEGNATLTGNVRVSGNAVIRGNVSLDRGKVSGRAVVEGAFCVTEPAVFVEDARIQSRDDFLYLAGLIEPCTVFRTQHGGWTVRYGDLPSFDLGSSDEEMLALCEDEVSAWGFGDSEAMFQSLKAVVEAAKSLIGVE